MKMTREQWEAKQNALKKEYRYIPNGNPGEVDAEEINPKDYETELSPEEEIEFQKWLDKNKKEGKIQEGDYNFYKENGYGYDYDYRAAYKAGLKPQISKVDNEWHWGDYGKKPSHPSFSNESMYYKYIAKPGVGGYWKGEKYEKNPVVGPPIPPKVK